MNLTILKGIGVSDFMPIHFAMGTNKNIALSYQALTQERPGRYLQASYNGADSYIEAPAALAVLVHLLSADV